MRVSLTFIYGHRAGGDARQAGGALDAGKDCGDEDGVEADVYEGSEHFWVAHKHGWLIEG